MIRFFIAMLMLAGAAAATDGAKPNFSGDWKLNASRSNFGQLPRPVEYERKIDHKEPLIQMTVWQVTQLGNQTVDTMLRTDGQEITNKTRTGEAKTVGKWVGRDLQLVTTRAVEGGVAVTTETWSLSPDGKTLVSVTDMKTPRGAFQVRMTLEKQ